MGREAEVTVAYRNLDEQSFWDIWGKSLRLLLGDEHFQQLGIDVRAIIRTTWWEAKQMEERTSSTDAPVEPKKPPRVLVVIPVFNQAWCLRETIGSLLAQTFRDFVLVMIDDGSTDGSPALIEQIAGENPQIRIAWLQQQNAGASAARMAGIRAVPSEFIFPLDGDDQIAPTALEEYVAALDADPGAGFAYSDIRTFGDEHFHWKSEAWSVERIKAKNFVPIASMIRRKAYDAVGGYRPEERMCADWGLWMSMAEHGVGGIYIPKPLFRYRRHHGQWSNGGNERDRAELTALCRKNRPALFGGGS